MASARITAKVYDALVAAIRAEPDNLQAIADRFSLGRETVLRLRASVGRQG